MTNTSSPPTRRRRRGRSRTSRPVTTTSEVYGKIAHLQATLYQMRGERLARAERGDFGVSPKRTTPRRRRQGQHKVRCLSPVTRWKSRQRRQDEQRRSGETTALQVLRSLSPLKNVLDRVSKGRRELQQLVEDNRNCASRGRSILQEVQRSASRGRVLFKRENCTMQEQNDALKATQEESVKSKPVSLASSMSMAERTKVRLEEKQRKIERIKQEMMQECTFTPETNHSTPPANSGTNRNAGSGGRNVAKHKNTRQHSTRVIATPMGTFSTKSKETTLQEAVETEKRESPQSLSSSSGTATSSRLQELYLDGVRRNRACTDQTEAEMRKRRWEEKELQQCTFKPRLNWRKKATPLKNPQGRALFPNVLYADGSETLSMGTLTLCSVNDMPPIEITTKKKSSSSIPIIYATPPKVSVIELSPDLATTSTNKSRVNKSLGAAFEAARSDSADTEYGSI